MVHLQWSSRAATARFCFNQLNLQAYNSVMFLEKYFFYKFGCQPQKTRIPAIANGLRIYECSQFDDKHLLLVKKM